MVTKEVIDTIYKKYRNRPASPDMLNLPLLFEYAIENHGIYVDDGNLVIESLDETSPFHTIPLDRIHAIIEFERYVAIVLHSAIIFLSKSSSEAHVHVRMHKQSFMDRLRDRLSGENHPDF